MSQGNIAENCSQFYNNLSQTKNARLPSKCNVTNSVSSHYITLRTVLAKHLLTNHPSLISGLQVDFDWQTQLVSWLFFLPSFLSFFPTTMLHVFGRLSQWLLTPWIELLQGDSWISRLVCCKEKMYFSQWIPGQNWKCCWRCSGVLVVRVNYQIVYPPFHGQTLSLAQQEPKEERFDLLFWGSNFNKMQNGMYFVTEVGPVVTSGLEQMTW